MKVFPWIEFLFARLESKYKQKLPEIRQLVLDRIGDILNVSTRATKNLIEKYFAENKMKIVKSLEASPELQLKYLEEELEEDDSTATAIKSGRFSEEIDLYIRLLCQSKDKTQRKKIPEKLKKYETLYKLEDALYICEKNNVKSALSYLEERFGNLDKATKYKIEVIIKFCRKTH